MKNIYEDDHPSYDDHSTSPSQNSPIVQPNAPFHHRDMIGMMMVAAEKHSRDFLDDVIRLIIIYYKHGSNNLDRIMKNWQATEEQKQNLHTMLQIYGIRGNASYQDLHPTLAYISEALPHLSMALYDQLLSCPTFISRITPSDKELGVTLSHHFKMSYFPGLIEHDKCSLRVQLGLLLFNVCHTRIIVKTSACSMNPVQAFAASCKFTIHILAQDLAPRNTRKKFTEYVENLEINADQMDTVWTRVLGDMQINPTSTTMLTSVHQMVFKAQPLTLEKWQEILVVCQG